MIPKIHSRLFTPFFKCRNLIPISLPYVVFALLYLGVIVGVVKNWFTQEGSYGLFILASSLFMIWSKRKELHLLSIRPQILMGSSLIIIGCLTLLAGQFSGTFMLQAISLVITLLGLILVAFGYSYLKELWLPIGYLAIMFGLFEELLGNISLHLQYVTAFIAYNLLKLTNIPVVLSAQFIQLPHITLEVARTCNGMNHIIALIALSVPIAFITQRSWQRIMILIISALFIGIFSNGLRVALISVWTTYKKGGPLHGPFDIFYLSFIFFFGMILLVLFSILTRRKKNLRFTFKPLRLKSSDEGLFQSSKLQLQTDISFKSNTLYFKGTAIAITILLITVAYAQFCRPQPIYLKSLLTTFPHAIGDWLGHDLTEIGKPFEELSSDLSLKRAYRDPSGSEIKIYIGYIAFQNQGKKIMDYRLNQLYENAQWVSIPFENGFVQIKKTVSTQMDHKRIIYFWYDINGRILVDRYQTKIATIQDSFIKRRNNGAFIALFYDQHVQEQNMKIDDLQIMRSVFPMIKTHLNTLSQ